MKRLAARLRHWADRLDPPTKTAQPWATKPPEIKTPDPIVAPVEDVTRALQKPESTAWVEYL